MIAQFIFFVHLVVTLTGHTQKANMNNPKHVTSTHAKKKNNEDKIYLNELYLCTVDVSSSFYSV